MTKRIAKSNKWGDRSRFYTVGKNEYPSVTTILSAVGKPALINWAAKVEREMVIEVAGELYQTVSDTPKMSTTAWKIALIDKIGKTKASQKELTKASEIGSQAHSRIEWEIKRQLLHDVGPCPIISPQAQLAVGAWERWKNSVRFNPLLCEQAVWSDIHEYAGTMDLIAEINGEITLLDWKTGKAVYKEAHLQNAAYRMAVLEMELIPNLDESNLKGMVVRLPKVETDPEFEIQPITENLGSLFGTFLCTRNLWRWLNAKEELVLSPEAEPAKSAN